MLLNLRLGLQIVFLFLHLISRWVFFLSFFFFFLRGGQILVSIVITYLSSLHLVVYMNSMFKPA